MALTEKQQEKVHVCENNWMRRIVGVKRVGKRRLDELRVEVGVKDQMPRKWRENGSEEAQESDGRTSLREVRD